MQNKLKLFLIIAALFTFTFFAPKEVLAATKYVSVTGSDTNSGTEESPYRTIQKGADTSDDTVTVLEGTYDERVTVNRSGLEFKSRGGKAKMRGFVINADRVSITGFEIYASGEGDDGVGILMLGNSCQIEDNYIHDTKKEGIKLNNVSKGCKIKKNKIRNSSLVPITPTTSENTDTVIEENDVSTNNSAASPTPAPTTAAPTLKKGDANKDGKVDMVDFTDFWLVNYLKMIKGYVFGDFDDSGKVDGVDYVIWVKNFGK